MANGKEVEIPQEEILAQMRQNFMHGFSQVLIYRYYYNQNGNNPFYIDIEQDNQSIPLVIDDRFIQAMNAGAERMYRELCSAGNKEEADEIMTQVRTTIEETP